MIRRLLLVAMILFPVGAHAQATGKFTAGHPLVATGPSGVPYKDGGPASDGKLTELGITNTGSPFCIKDALTTSPSGFHQFCLGAFSLGGGLITYNAFGGATALPLRFDINGSTFDFPGNGQGNILGPNSSTIGDVICWANTGGTLAEDCGSALRPNVLAYGADPTGAADATSALQNCLNAAHTAPGGTCEIGPLPTYAAIKLKLLGNISIPENTTLDCRTSFPDSEDSDIAVFASLPALMLDQTRTINGAGQGATIKNCLIYRNGMTFPAANSSAFAGIAVADGGNENFIVKDSVILGFDTCLYITGPRPYLIHNYVDCKGVTHAAVEIDTGNTDSGYVRDIKIQPIATGNGNCTNSVRAGTGFRMGGSGGPGAYIDGIVSQNFQTAQFDFKTYTEVGQIWADNINGTGAGCGAGGFGSSIGVLIGPGASINANLVQISATQTGMLVQSNGAQGYIGKLSFAGIGQDALVLGDGSHSGNVTVGAMAAISVARYAINVTHASSSFIALLMEVSNVNGGVVPYFFSSISPTTLQNINNPFYIGALISDLAASVNLYSSNFTAGSGSDVMLGGLTPSVVSCTGLGTGSCAIVSSAGGVNGYVTLSPTGSPGSSGAITMDLPIAAQSGVPICGPVLLGGSSAWPTSSFVSTTDTTASRVVLNWQAGSALTAGQTYRVGYRCGYI